MISPNICLLQIATADCWKKITNFNSTNLPPCDRLRKNCYINKILESLH